MDLRVGMCLFFQEMPRNVVVASVVSLFKLAIVLLSLPDFSLPMGKVS